MKKKRKKVGFWESLEEYFWKKTEKISPTLLSFSFGLLVIGTSLVFSGKRKAIMQAGAYPFEVRVVDELIKNVAAQGDYELAQKLYEERNVLGIDDKGNKLEEIVYPEKKLQRILEEHKSILKESPYLRNALINIARLYKNLGEEEKAQEYWKKVEWVYPSN